MSGRFFLDTTVFVYCFDPSSPAKADLAAGLIRRAIETRAGIVSFQVVQEFFNVALRRFVKPMTPPDAEHYLATVFRPLLAVHSSQGLYAEALRLADRYRLSWYDSLIVAAALESGCSVLYSEDLQHGFEVGEMRIQNPFHRL